METIFFKDADTAYKFANQSTECFLISGSTKAYSGESECIRMVNINTGDTDYLLVIDEQEYDNAPIKDRNRTLI